MQANIVLIPGDGIGPEVIEEGRRTLDEVARRFGHTFRFSTQLLGGCAIDACGTALPDFTLSACRSADAVLLGAVGGPKWDDPRAQVRPEQGLLGLRRGLGLYANIRPVRPHPSLVERTPLKADRLDGVDIVVIRELTGGLYFGARGRKEADGRRYAFDTMEYTDEEVRRVVRLAFQLARGRRKRVTSVDKANVLDASRLWREVTAEVAADFPDVTLEHQLVDSTAMRLVTAPRSFDVVVTENMFGDILTDEAAVLAGSLGLLPSASLGEGALGLYEPIHGSAPDIAGKGVANPVGTILSAALLLRHSLGLAAEAAAVERAVERVLSDGLGTADVGGAQSTRELGDAVRARLADA